MLLDVLVLLKGLVLICDPEELTPDIILDDWAHVELLHLVLQYPECPVGVLGQRVELSLAGSQYLVLDLLEPFLLLVGVLQEVVLVLLEHYPDTGKLFLGKLRTLWHHLGEQVSTLRIGLVHVFQYGSPLVTVLLKLLLALREYPEVVSPQLLQLVLLVYLLLCFLGVSVPEA